MSGAPNTKGSRSCPWVRRERSLLLAEAVAELLDAPAHVVHGLLRARVEGVRFARGVQLEQRQLAAVVRLAGFLGRHARTRHELEAVGKVHEEHFAVVGVNAFFHGMSCFARFGWAAGKRIQSSYLPWGEPAIIA